MTADVELPEPKYPVDGAGDEDSYNSGWNDCLAECRRATAAKDAEIEALRAEVAEWKASYQQAADASLAHAERAERLAEALRGLMLNSPGGHSCEEFHHYKSDRHMPGDDCPVQLRWNKAVTTAQAALRDHDQEVGNGSV